MNHSSLNKEYATIYSIVGLGLLLSTITSVLLFSVFKPFVITYLTNPIAVIIIAMIELLLVTTASSYANKDNPIALSLFLGYSITTGILFSTLPLIYKLGSIFMAFLSSTLLFFILGILSRFIKKDLSSLSKFLMSAIIGILIISILNLFIHSSLIVLIISYISLLIFSLLIVINNQDIKNTYYRKNGYLSTGDRVNMALSLYIDFINIFISILQILGKSND